MYGRKSNLKSRNHHKKAKQNTGDPKCSTLEANNKELAEELNTYKKLYIDAKDCLFEKDKHIQFLEHTYSMLKNKESFYEENSQKCCKYVYKLMKVINNYNKVTEETSYFEKSPSEEQKDEEDDDDADNDNDSTLSESFLSVTVADHETSRNSNPAEICDTPDKIRDTSVEIRDTSEEIRDTSEEIRDTSAIDVGLDMDISENEDNCIANFTTMLGGEESTDTTPKHVSLSSHVPPVAAPNRSPKLDKSAKNSSISKVSTVTKPESKPVNPLTDKSAKSSSKSKQERIPSEPFHFHFFTSKKKDASPVKNNFAKQNDSSMFNDEENAFIRKDKLFRSPVKPYVPNNIQRDVIPLEKIATSVQQDNFQYADPAFMNKDMISRSPVRPLGSVINQLNTDFSKETESSKNENTDGDIDGNDDVDSDDGLDGDDDDDDGEDGDDDDDVEHIADDVDNSQPVENISSESETSLNKNESPSKVDISGRVIPHVDLSMIVESSHEDNELDLQKKNPKRLQTQFEEPELRETINDDSAEEEEVVDDQSVLIVPDSNSIKSKKDNVQKNLKMKNPKRLQTQFEEPELRETINDDSAEEEEVVDDQSVLIVPDSNSIKSKKDSVQKNLKMKRKNMNRISSDDIEIDEENSEQHIKHMDKSVLKILPNKKYIPKIPLEDSEKYDDIYEIYKNQTINESLIIAKSSYKDFKIYEEQKKSTSENLSKEGDHGILKRKKMVTNNDRKTVAFGDGTCPNKDDEKCSINRRKTGIISITESECADEQITTIAIQASSSNEDDDVNNYSKKPVKGDKNSKNKRITKSKKLSKPRIHVIDDDDEEECIVKDGKLSTPLIVSTPLEVSNDDDDFSSMRSEVKVEKKNTMNISSSDDIESSSKTTLKVENKNIRKKRIHRLQSTSSENDSSKPKIDESKLKTTKKRKHIKRKIEKIDEDVSKMKKTSKEKDNNVTIKSEVKKEKITPNKTTSNEENQPEGIRSRRRKIVNYREQSLNKKMRNNES